MREQCKHKSLDFQSDHVYKCIDCNTTFDIGEEVLQEDDEVSAHEPKQISRKTIILTIVFLVLSPAIYLIYSQRDSLKNIFTQDEPKIIYKEKIVKVPYEKIVYKDKIIEVPKEVEKIVYKTIEKPVYVDRPVYKIVKKPIYKTVEKPIWVSGPCPKADVIRGILELTEKDLKEVFDKYRVDIREDWKDEMFRDSE